MTDAINVTPLDVAKWDRRLDGVIGDMRGQPLNVHRLMANHPALLEAWWSLRKHAVAGGSLRQRHRELIILRVAVQMKCWYEWASHVDRGLKAGLSIEEIRRVRYGKDESAWEASDALVLRATDEIFHTQRISLQTRTEMQQFFDAAQLMDLAVIYGVYVVLGTMINTWGLALDDSVDLPPGMGEEF